MTACPVSEALREPIVSKLDFASMPVLAYTVAAPRMDAAELSWYVDNDIAKRLLALYGVWICVWV